LPESHRSRLPVRDEQSDKGDQLNEREILYKVLFDLRQEMHDLKKLVMGLLEKGGDIGSEESALIDRLFNQSLSPSKGLPEGRSVQSETNAEGTDILNSRQEGSSATQGGSGSMQLGSGDQSLDNVEEVEEILSLQDSEKELIRRALLKHGNRRKHAAFELGISERTLYRKIKEYGLK
jgi:transcriptional regulator of acetoin/glycerol metabolism